MASCRRTIFRLCIIALSSRLSLPVVLTMVLLLPWSDRAGAQQPLKPSATVWQVTSDFGKHAEHDALDKQPRTNLSGAVCPAGSMGRAFCLMVNDEKKYAQFFALQAATIVPGALIRLTDHDGEPDAEGAAYADGYIYATGSHGRSRNKDAVNDASYVVFRFPVDRQTGQPSFPISEERLSGVASTTRVRDALRDSPSATIKQFYNTRLADGGVNVEGIAVQGGRLYLGLRGPSDNGQAFLVHVDANAAFTPAESLDAQFATLALGPHAGMRDLASVQGGILVLSGPVNDQAVAPALFLWDPTKPEVIKALGVLEIPEHLRGKAKAEILLVLDDVPTQPWRVLVMFDGPENGAPVEYVVFR
ncbi:MAG: DUF3616 domain-containing protein [Candidatus Tectimicrobiota bacterium]